MKRSKYLPSKKKKGYNSLIRVNSSIKTYHSRIIWTKSNPFMIQDTAGLRLNTMLNLFLLKHNSWWFLYHFYLGQDTDFLVNFGVSKFRTWKRLGIFTSRMCIITKPKNGNWHSVQYANVADNFHYEEKKWRNVGNS